MKCPSCGDDMKSRDGKYGMFWYCPGNSKCGQSTISDSQVIKSSSPARNRGMFYGEKEDHESHYGSHGINW